MARHPNKLCIMPAVRAARLEHGALLLNRRFVSGLEAYRDNWDGPLTALLETESRDALKGDLGRAGDLVEVHPEQLPFKIHPTNFQGPALFEHLEDCSVVLATVNHRQNHVARRARALRVPVVYVSELSIKTRIQIERADVRNPLRVARRVAWHLRQEHLHRRAIRTADGLQANGVPTFKAYKRLSRNPLLFFDTRQRSDMLPRDGQLEARLGDMLMGRPLRMTWCGRLTAIKGPLLLIDIARGLKQRGLVFTLDIFGDGDLRRELDARIKGAGLEECVRPRGFMAFEDLIREMRTGYDLWLCCHRQGDPSSSYLETLASGLPIVGYENEALAGLLEVVDAGSVAPSLDVDAIAEKLCRLNREREQLARWSRNALRFAREHTFEKTFSKRVQHLQGVIDQASHLRAS